ncbi:hypothetical protein RI129_000275 [Pyrocoelia pectoralis]|uniref:Major facilitator superfamily (MFS) profile domain-containing protein n=1 Tax=Pyrocoelia pectoralis TaxID=417401 RepID=A0AAN7VRY2_9COLE
MNQIRKTVPSDRLYFELHVLPLLNLYFITGFGLYHYFALGMSCACAFSQATVLASLPFAIPLTVCDSTSWPNLVHSVDLSLYMGMAFGGYILSSMADLIGRRSMIPITLIIIFGSTFACGFAHTSHVIIICIFILGSGIAANANTVKIHLAEILPNKRRGSLLAFQDLFWTIGYAAGAAWLLTPPIVQHRKEEVRFATWRMIFGLSGICSIMVSCASALLLPSPRYLMFLKNYQDTIDTLTRMYTINNSKHWETFSIRSRDLQGCVDDFNLNNYIEPITCRDRLVIWFKKIRTIVSVLFQQKYLKVTLLLIAAKFIVIFDLLTTNIWLGQTVRSNDQNCVFTTSSLNDDSYKCEDLPASLYGNFFHLSINIFIGQLILLLIVERIGRRLSLVCGCVACGISSYIPTYIRKTYAAKFVTSSIFLTGYSLIDSALNIVLMESYPTAIRGTAAGGVQFFARFVGGMLKRFLIISCQRSLILMGSFMLAGAIICYFLPEYSGKPMEE